MTHAPDTDDGYFKIANTMLPVLMDVPIRREAKFVLLEVIAQCWGKSKLKSATISLRTIAIRWGFPRVDNVKRGFVQLKELGILKEVGSEFTVTIDKRTLVNLLPSDVQGGLDSYGEAAKTIYKGARKSSLRTEDESTDSSLPAEVISTNTSLRECHEGGGDLTPMGVKNGTPYNPLKEEDRRQKTEESISPRERDFGNDYPGDETPDPEVLKSIQALIHSRVDPCQNNGQLWAGIRKHQFVFKTGWMLKALKRAILSNPQSNRLPNWNYVVTILRGWIATGPDAGIEDGYTDTLGLASISPGAPQSIPMRPVALTPYQQRRQADKEFVARKNAEIAAMRDRERMEATSASA